MGYKWNVHELHNMLIQAESKLKKQGVHSINFMGPQGVKRKPERIMKRVSKGHIRLMRHLPKSIRGKTKMIDVTFIENLDAIRKIVQMGKHG